MNRKRYAINANGIRWRMYIAWISLNWIPRINLGDQVIYSGKEYTVINGVRSESWRLSDSSIGDDGWVTRSDCRKVRSLKNYLGSYAFAYRFYMTSWFEIWMKQGIKQWMRQCSIW